MKIFDIYICFCDISMLVCGIVDKYDLLRFGFQLLPVKRSDHFQIAPHIVRAAMELYNSGKLVTFYDTNFITKLCQYINLSRDSIFTPFISFQPEIKYQAYSCPDNTDNKK